jgi:hypothetical protein
MTGPLRIDASTHLYPSAEREGLGEMSTTA